LAISNSFSENGLLVCLYIDVIFHTLFSDRPSRHWTDFS